MKLFHHLLPLIILAITSTISLELSTLPQGGDNQSITNSPSTSYKVHFLSLKRGHKITSSHFNLKDHEIFDITIPNEKFLKTKGNYTKKGLQFKASFEGTIIKQKKHYCYTFTITGISLLDSYIAGIVVLNESIKETQQDQQVTFLFIGMPEGNDISDDKKRNAFPF